MVVTSVRAPGVRLMRSRMTSSMTVAGRPFSSATRSRSAGSKAISPRMARSVMAATCVFEVHEVGQFVDAFLSDHGGIHVGEEKLLAPASGRLHHYVDAAGKPFAQHTGDRAARRPPAAG